ncbi:unnamed protein product [Paramecium primaurelia]|uniref:Ubiquitin-like modifier-activating enzyme ATG7 n=1 Tax=Paramecium primaurelia TaxID=5886 RepID=A0A8S1NAR6_PARPR|nr:unnamed protein product [Paramecium primaurelia]
MQFIPFSPLIDIGFWSQLSKNKIEIYKLDDGERSLLVKTKINPYQEKTSQLYLDIYAFQDEITLNKSGPFEVYSRIQFQNYNTIETYQEFDHLNYVQQTFKKMIESFSKDEKPNLFQGRMSIFADLKKYLFYYKLVVPQFQIENIQNIIQKSLTDYLGDQMQLFQQQLSLIIQQQQKEISNTSFVILRKENLQYVQFDEYQKNKQDVIFLYFDSYNQAQLNGQFNNFLAYLITNNSIKDQLNNIKIIVIKDALTINKNQFSLKNSIYLELNLSESKIIEQNGQYKAFNIEGYLQEKKIDLKSFMDEQSLAREAVDLNIKLMKWRLLPELDLEKVQTQKVLLIGAGTLGCQLARNLIGWGIRKITFVDYGKISYSNPVRQSLYDFEDSTKGGRPKAEVAAEKLKKIFPDIESEGYQLQIPMPGHFVTELQVQQTLESFYKLSELVSTHDAVFLLTDSRESRWLPTVLSNAYGKMCFSVALGFDSFLIIRHGISLKKYNPEIHGERLACYFCNDISSPGNSMKDRTLDQQCTVTRPGLSFLASAYSSELFVSLIHSPLLDGTPASDNTEQLQQTDLGILPHFLRGQLSDFEVRLFYGRAFKHCVACSQQILDALEKNPQSFLLEALNRPDVLQDISGITEELTQNKQEIHEIQDIDGDDECSVLQIIS